MYRASQLQIQGRGEDNCSLFCYYAASSGNFVPTFRDNLSGPSSRICFLEPLGWDTAVAQWLRCCATIRKVAGSIPAGVSGSFLR